MGHVARPAADPCPQLELAQLEALDRLRQEALRLGEEDELVEPGREESGAVVRTHRHLAHGGEPSGFEPLGRSSASSSASAASASSNKPRSVGASSSSSSSADE